mmetsp:Transcript_24358/g.66098  ORF Transcript_24358/g.66098 Transcript_24358/m.66098 type:complete len:281 (+) Transcript_24358:956-1798(+)
MWQTFGSTREYPTTAAATFPRSAPRPTRSSTSASSNSPKSLGPRTVSCSSASSSSSLNSSRTRVLARSTALFAPLLTPSSSPPLSGMRANQTRVACAALRMTRKTKMKTRMKTRMTRRRMAKTTRTTRKTKIQTTRLVTRTTATCSLTASTTPSCASTTSAGTSPMPAKPSSSSRRSSSPRTSTTTPPCARAARQRFRSCARGSRMMAASFLASSATWLMGGPASPRSASMLSSLLPPKCRRTFGSSRPCGRSARRTSPGCAGTSPPLAPGQGASPLADA